MATNNILNTSLSGQTGTGAFAGSDSPVFTTPNIGAASGSSLSVTGNIACNNIVSSLSSVAAGGTTTLTVNSPKTIVVSGVGASTIILPDATTLSVGFTFYINNNTNNTITVQTSNLSTIVTLQAGNYMQLYCTGIGTSIGTWDYHFLLPASATSGTLIVGNGAAAGYRLTTATYPLTTTINQILYSSAANTITGLATANSAQLVTNSTGVPALTASMTNGQIVIGSTGGTPSPATLTAGTGITITNASNSVTVTAKTGGLNWQTISGTTQSAAVNNGYVCNNNSTAITVTLPGSCVAGDVVALEGLGSAGWILKANTAQTIKIGTSSTSSAGTLTFNASSDNIYVTCIVGSTTWQVRSTNSAGLTIA